MSVMITLTVPFKNTSPSTTVMVISSPKQRCCRIQPNDSLCLNSAFQYVVEQDVGQSTFGIFQQRFDGAFRQCGKSVIGGGEDGELTLAGEGLNQAGSFQRSDQGGEVAVFHGDFRDGLGVSSSRHPSSPPRQL